MAPVVSPFVSYAVARSRNAFGEFGYFCTCFNAFETDVPLPPKMLMLLNSCDSPLEPDPTPRNAKVAAKRSARMKYIGFALRRMRTKKSCWFGLPPDACLRRPRARGFGEGAFACCACLAACFAFTAARAICDSEYRLRRHGLPPPLGEPREPDRALEERPHRQQLERRRQQVGPWKPERDDGDDEVADPAVPPQACRREHADVDEAEDRERKLEDHGHAEQDGGDERVVRLRLHDDVELARVVVRQPVHGAREQHPVAEREPGGGERDRESDEARDPPLGRGVDGRHEEHPHLPEDDRQREDEAGV